MGPYPTSMKSPALLSALRDTFYQLQTLTASPDLKGVITYYSDVVNQPLIVNLHTVYVAMLNQAAAGQSSLQIGVQKRLPVFAPVNEHVLLTFCQRYEHMLKPPKSIEVGSSPLILPFGCCTLPIDSLETCMDVYLSIKPVPMSANRSLF